MMNISTPLWVKKILAKLMDDEHHFIEGIWPLQKLSGISRKDFDASYQAFYEKANRLLRESGLAVDLTDQPRIAGYMMKELQGSAYQFACDTSDQNSTDTAVRFAVFAACIIDHIVACTFRHDRWAKKMKSICPSTHPTGDQSIAAPESVRLLLLMRLANPPALKWLGENPVVLDELIAFLDRQRPTRITDLIQNGQQTLALKRMPRSKFEIAHKSVTFDNAGISFLAWIRGELKSENLSVNCVDSLVHRLDNKAYLIANLAFAKYAEISKVPSKNIGRSLVGLGLHELNNRLDQFSVLVGEKHKYAAMVFSDKVFWSRPPSPSNLIRILKSPPPPQEENEDTPEADENTDEGVVESV
jgi:hypothetical protein